MRIRRDPCSSGSVALLILAVWLVSAGLTVCQAADPPGVRSETSPHRRIEAVEMISALAHGSQMGPGEGWFHPGESRYGWGWLAARCGVDRNGDIGPQAWPGTAGFFERLDRDGNGVVNAEDFDWSERSAFLRQAGAANQRFRQIDITSNGRISRQEWDAFFEQAAQGKDHLTPDDFRKALFAAPGNRPKNPPPNDAPTPLVLIAGLLKGEVGSFLEGPRVGRLAPDFTLATADGKSRVSLAEFRGKTPVVLIFGSFT